MQRADTEGKVTKSLTEEKICVSNKYTQRYPTSLVIRDMHIKTGETISHPFHWENVESLTMPSAGEYADLPSLYQGWGITKQYHHFGKPSGMIS